MLVVTTIWWLLFWTVLGLCIGSFLNVVIHRLPRGQSLRDPVWSYCPNCLHCIRWYDNLPVVSFIRLGGRCRDCRAPISMRYPIVEMAAALVLLAIFDAFFVARTRIGLCNEPYLTWALAEDWPIFLAHIALFACLLAMAAIDLREYWVDIRFTTVAVWLGLVLHTLWTPLHSLAGPSGHGGWLRPSDPTAMGALAAMLGLGLVRFGRHLCRRAPAPADIHGPRGDVSQPPDQPEEAPGESALPSGGSGPPEAEAVGDQPGPGAPALGSPGGVVVTALILLGTLIWMGLDAADPARSAWGAARTLVPVLLVFVLILIEASVPRQADRDIVQAIEAERFSARRRALSELGMLVPAIVLGAAAVWIQLAEVSAGQRLSSLLHYRVGATWEPFYGLTTAVAGYVIGGGIGWAVRIFFTLLFGKEAFGLGDIHMMAAAGCVAGWPVVLLGFLVTVFAALLAWLLMLPFKQTRAIPLVPWLALGYLVVVINYTALLEFRPVRNTIEVVNMLILDKSQPPVTGVLR